MRMEALIGSWHGTRRLLAVMAAIALGLTLAVAVLAMQLAGRERTVVLVPPVLAGELALSRSGVGEDFLKTWGLFVAQTVGNVTPGTVRMARATLEPLLAPAIHGAVVARLEAEIEKIETDRVTLSFAPRRVAADVATGRVWVEGYANVTTIGEGRERAVKTYEVMIENAGYRPLITDLRTYEGPARVEEAE